MTAEKNVIDLMDALFQSVEQAKADRRKRLDEDVQRAGFYGYENCPHSTCPSPFLCSEKGDCRG